ncbi:MAG: ABC transporter permease [bacterium]
MIRETIRRLRQNKLLLPAFLVLFLLYFSSIFAGFLSPYTYKSADRSKSYHPPTAVHVVDEDGLTWPYIYEYEYHFNDASLRVYEKIEGTRSPITFFTEGEEYNFLGLIPTNFHLFGVKGDARIYLLGADSRGRDLFSRILYGGRVSLSIGLVGVAISLFIGLLVGGFSGYVGGWVDSAVQRLIEMVMMVPAFFLLLALRTAFPPDWSSIKVYFFIVLIMSFIGWAGMARVIRGMALSLREKDFVRAARALGTPDWKIITFHIIPNTASYFIVAATVNIPGYILGESALSLLGLGIQDPQASWGNLLQDAMSVTQIKFHPWILLPGFFIFLAVMSFNLVGGAMRDWFDPEQELRQSIG